MALRRPAAAALACALLALCAGHAAAQTQAAALDKLRTQLAPEGWTGLDPSGDACASPGTVTPGVICEGSTVTALYMKGKNLQGQFPSDASLWADLPGLTKIDFSNNPGLTGELPDVFGGNPNLIAINLDNTGMTGGIPQDLAGKVTGIAGAPSMVDDGTVQVPSASPEATPAPAAAPSPSPAADQQQQQQQQQEQQQAASPSPAPEQQQQQAAAPAPAPAPAPVPDAIISNAPICACALQGVGSSDCLKTLETRCSDQNVSGDVKEACDNAAKASSDANAAASLASLLAKECFAGQGMSDSPCVCFRDPNSNDCAKARLGLCINKDPLCVPFQMGTDPVAVASYARDRCPVAAPEQSGVQVNMTFPQLSLQKWSAELTQNIGNAIAANGNVSASAVRLSDVRPSVSGAAGRRRLLQSSNGVQAVYFVNAQDPDAVNTRLQLAASDGSLAKSLIAYGVPSGNQPSVVLKSFFGGPQGGSSFPMWAIAPIVIGALLLLGLIIGGFIWSKRRDAQPRHAEFAPAPITGTSEFKAAPPAKPAQPVTKDYHSSAPYEAVATAAHSAAAPAAAATRSVRAAAPAPAAASAAAAYTPSPSAPVEAPPAPAPVRTASPAATAPASGSSAAAAVSSSAGPAPVGVGARQQWKTNVRPAAEAAAVAGASSVAVNSMTSSKQDQQAERAKFWAQFQETWQQVRETKRLKEDGDPGTPSSGTNWTETTGGGGGGAR